MERGTGSLVVLGVALAWSLGTTAPALPDKPAPQTKPASRASEERTQFGEKLLEQYLGTDRPPAPGSRSPVEVSVLIATLPDPDASHLDWAFDSHFDSIRRAFERAGYVMDRFAMPWGKKPTERAALPKRPGVVLFRRASGPGTRNERKAPAPGVALLYVVGEMSTGGIDRTAFQIALNERSDLLRWYPPEPAEGGRAQGADERDVLRIVGPVFSGSAPSLRMALDLPSPALEGTQRVDIISGAATGPGNADVLARKSAPAITFRSTLHTDRTLLAVLEDYVLRDLGLKPAQVAILQESTTEYGKGASAVRPAAQEPDAATRAQGRPASRPAAPGHSATAPAAPAAGSADHEFLRIPFPMSIASLRRAYLESNKTAPPDAALLGNAAPANVTLDLRGASLDSETINATSSLTPATIDLLLEEVARMLAQRSIRAVLIFATDVRDKLFLGSEIKKRRPDVQLFTTEGNALYLRPEFNQWLRGMIVLSTYPLLLRSSSWRSQSSDDQQLMFANEGAEGTFNAVLVHLGGTSALADYGHPIRNPAADGKPERPPVWATVVGAGEMLPLAVYEPDRRAAAGAAASPRTGTSASGQAPERTIEVPAETPASQPTGVDPDSAEASETGLGLLSALVTSVLALLVITVVALDWTRREKSLSTRILRDLPDPSPHWPERHARILRISLALHHELYTTFLYMAVWGLLLPNVMLLVLQDMKRLHALNAPLWLGAAASLLGLLALLAHAWKAGGIALDYRKEGTRHLASRDWPIRGQRFWWKAEFVLRLAVVGFGLYYFLCTASFCLDLSFLSASTDDPARFRLFLRRAIEVDQGVSPVVPLMLLGIILFAWCEWHRRRIHLLSIEEPAEAALRRLDSPDTAPAPRPDSVRYRLFHVLPDPISAFLLLVTLLAIGCTFFEFERALDDLVLRPRWLSSFDFLLRGGILGTLSASIWATWRMVSIWLAFARELRDQQRAFPNLPFPKLREELGSGPNLSLFPSTRAHDSEFAAERRWLRLLALEETRKIIAPGDSPESVLAAVRARTRDGTPVDAGLVHVLAGTLRVIRESKAATPVVADAGSPGPAKPAGPDAEWRTAAEGVVAIEFMLYVEWVLRNLRRLSFFILLSIVLTTLLIVSYPYQPQQVIQTVSVLVFAAVIASLVWLIGSMNRNSALSRLSGTPPGELTWDRTLYANLALYAAVPLLTLVSSQYPALRKLLFDWLDPVVKFLVKA